jgi:uncharacterized glyoxalase superfamily protein PhnB
MVAGPRSEHEGIIEIGEHPGASDRAAKRLSRVGLRLYVIDVDETYARALAAGVAGNGPSDGLKGSRTASVYDPFGLTRWLMAQRSPRSSIRRPHFAGVGQCWSQMAM